jgi:crossover junction endodeoxyribonuclease RuvC
MTIILGIDPGSRLMGYGLLEIKAGVNPRYLASGVIRVSQEKMSERLLEIDQNLQEIIQTYQPSAGAIEAIFMHQNPMSALKLGQARGVALLAMARAKMDIGEYSPREVKKSGVGYGAADKAQVQQMVKSLLNLNKTPQVDAADALAIALCHAQVMSYEIMLSKGGVK